jgi:hypothetical protein
MHAVTGRAELARYDVVEYRFEVIQEYGVRRALENKRKPPIWIYAAVGGKLGSTDDYIGE